MAIGVLTDVHGNSVALDAVVADARANGVDRWWLLGDLAAMGPDPAGALDRLRALHPDVLIMGNTERYVLCDESPFPPSAELDLTAELVDRMVETAASLAWTKGMLDAVAVDWLRSATTHHGAMLADGTRVLMVHASAVRDDGPGVSPDRSDDELAALFPDLDADVVLAGHTHHVTDRVVDGVRFVNPGSISNHATADRRAKYVIIHDRCDGHRIEFRAVDYDVERVIAELVDSELPGRGFVLGEYFGVAEERSGRRVDHRG